MHKKHKKETERKNIQKHKKNTKKTPHAVQIAVLYQVLNKQVPVLVPVPVVQVPVQVPVPNLQVPVPVQVGLLCINYRHSVTLQLHKVKVVVFFHIKKRTVRTNELQTQSVVQPVTTVFLLILTG